MLEKRATIRDVATLAGVSISTVSRVLRDENSVREERRIRVKKAIKELDFTPNVAAQQMHGQKECTIGAITTRSSYQAFGNPYFPSVIGAIGSVTEERGYNLQIHSYSDSMSEIRKTVRLFKSGQVNGFILLSSRVYDPLIVELMKNKIPFTLVGRVIENTIPDYDDIYWVNNDNIASSKGAVEYLIHKGHERIGILTAPDKYVVSQDRYIGYRQALVANGKEYHSRYRAEAGYSYEDAKQAAELLVRNNPDMTAIFATDDLKGVAAIEKLTEMGIRIPEQIAVMGCDNFEISKIIRPSLTTINIPIHSLGVAAATMLIDLLEGREVEERHVIFETEMILREST